MAERKSGIARDGYSPQLEKKGYAPVAAPANRPEPGAGYQPTGAGESPTNVPSPPKER